MERVWCKEGVERRTEVKRVIDGKQIMPYGRIAQYQQKQHQHRIRDAPQSVGHATHQYVDMGEYFENGGGSEAQTKQTHPHTDLGKTKAKTQDDGQKLQKAASNQSVVGGYHALVRFFDFNAHEESTHSNDAVQ